MAGMIDKWLTEDALLLITGWARDGLTLEDIAHNMGIALEAVKVIDHFRPEEFASVIQGRLIDNQRNSLCPYALHDILYCRGPEIVAVAFHGKTVDSDGLRIF